MSGAIDMQRSKWTLTGVSNPAASMRLFCFPYAGSGASVFRDWHKGFSGDVEVIGVQLPGRENRFAEDRLTCIDEVVDILLEHVPFWSDKPYFFFGHSMGALIAFELTRAIQRRGLPMPFHMVVSGTSAPQRRNIDDPAHVLDDVRFLERIRAYKAAPKELLENDEIMQLLLPQIRDDFAMFELWKHVDLTPARCPLTVFGGDCDDDVSVDDLLAWSDMSAGGFDYHIFAGDHFYIHPNKAALIERLRTIAEKQRGSLERTRQAKASL